MQEEFDDLNKKTKAEKKEVRTVQAASREATGAGSGFTTFKAYLSVRYVAAANSAAVSIA